MSMTIEQFGIDRLSEVERLDLLAAIWDSLPTDLPLPDWHRDELARRIADAGGVGGRHGDRRPDEERDVPVGGGAGSGPAAAVTGTTGPAQGRTRSTA